MKSWKFETELSFQAKKVEDRDFTPVSQGDNFLKKIDDLVTRLKDF